MLSTGPLPLPLLMLFADTSYPAKLLMTQLLTTSVPLWLNVSSSGF